MTNLYALPCDVFSLGRCVSDSLVMRHAAAAFSDPVYTPGLTVSMNLTEALCSNVLVLHRSRRHGLAGFIPQLAAVHIKGCRP